MDLASLSQNIDQLESRVAEYESGKADKNSGNYHRLLNEVVDLESKSQQLAQGGGNTAWKAEVEAFLDSMTLKSLYFSEDWVFIVTDLVASKISAQPLRVMKRTVKENKFALEPADNHPLHDVFENPNQWQDYHSWMYNTVIELALMGNAIIWWGKKNRNLTTLPTELITLDIDKKNRVKNYLLSTTGDVDQYGKDDHHIKFGKDEIMHVRKPNPSSLIWGLSPFVSGRKSVLFNRYSQDYLNAFYIRQATPSMALKIDKQVNEDVALRHLRTFEQAYTGRANQRRTMILPKGVDIKTLSHTLADQKLIEMIEKNRETIINLFKIPKHELGLQKVGSLGSEEHRLSLRNFWEASLVPMMKLIEGTVTKFFADQLGKDHVVKFDLTNVDALAVDKLVQANLAKELLESGWTVNEVRTIVYAKDPSEDDNADKPYNLVRLAKNTAMLGAREDGEAVANEEKPKEEDVEASEDKSELPSDVKAWVNMSNKQLDLELENKTGDIEREALDLFGEMASITVDEVIAKAISEDELSALDPLALVAAIVAAFTEIKRVWVDRLTPKLLPTVELGYDQQLDRITDPFERQRQQVLRDQGLEGRKRLLESRLGVAFEQLSESATKSVLAKVEDGIRAGKTINQIANDIVGFYDVDNAAWRAKRIARTEVLTAASIGQWESVKHAQTINPDIKKQWVTNVDGRERESHRRQHMQTIGVDDYFSNNLRFPRDPLSLDASEVVNCRCSLVIVK